MKKILAMAAVAALAAGASAYAANPFSDVSTSDWAYQAVSDLSDQGIVEGYPDGTFKGQTNITRYEMAQIIARLMAKEDQYNAEQRATIDKLAAEYADELDSLGVRVSNLEKKVGNISWSGDARMRYQSKDNSADESWQGRIRINMKGQVNDSTTVNARLTTGNVDLDDANNNNGEVKAEILNVKHDFGAWDVTLGRYANNFGNQGGWLYGSSDNFDGAQVAAEFGKVNLAVGYGQFNAGMKKLGGVDGQPKAETDDTFYAKAEADFGSFDLYANYLSMNLDVDSALKTAGYDEMNIWGVGLVVPISDFRVFGEYWQNTEDYGGVEDSSWNAGIGYGAKDLKKPGTWSLDLAYNDVAAATYFGGTGLNTDILDTLATGGKADKADKDGNQVSRYEEIKFWNAIAEVTLMQNVYLHAEYAFAAEGEGAEGDPDDTWMVSLNYVF